MIRNEEDETQAQELRARKLLRCIVKHWLLIVFSFLAWFVLEVVIVIWAATTAGPVAYALALTNIGFSLFCQLEGPKMMTAYREWQLMQQGHEEAVHQQDGREP